MFAEILSPHSLKLRLIDWSSLGDQGDLRICLSAFFSPGLQPHVTMWSFYMGSGYLNSDLHAFTASPLSHSSIIGHILFMNTYYHIQYPILLDTNHCCATMPCVLETWKLYLEQNSNASLFIQFYFSKEVLLLCRKKQIIERACMRQFTNSLLCMASMYKENFFVGIWFCVVHPYMSLSVVWAISPIWECLRGIRSSLNFRQ